MDFETPQQISDRQYQEQILKLVKQMIGENDPLSGRATAEELQAETRPSILAEKTPSQKVGKLLHSLGEFVQKQLNPIDEQGLPNAGISKSIVPTSLNREKFTETIRENFEKLSDKLPENLRYALAYVKTRYPQQYKPFDDKFKVSENIRPAGQYSPFVMADNTKEAITLKDFKPTPATSADPNFKANTIGTIVHELTHGRRANTLSDLSDPVVRRDKWQNLYSKQAEQFGYPNFGEEIAPEQAANTARLHFANFIEAQNPGAAIEIRARVLKDITKNSKGQGVDPASIGKKVDTLYTQPVTTDIVGKRAYNYGTQKTKSWQDLLKEYLAGQD